MSDQQTYLQRRMAHILNNRPLPEKKKFKSIAPKSEKRKQKEAEQKKAGTKEELDMWFDRIAANHAATPSGGCFCMECNEWIPPQYMRHATAHLLPKKLFKSVQTHELNYLILGAGCGCHDKTHRVDKFITMKIWPEAARRINIMMPLLPFDELKYLSSQLLTALEKVLASRD